jgi:hypothetical protein
MSSSILLRFNWRTMTPKGNAMPAGVCVCRAWHMVAASVQSVVGVASFTMQ